jgi:Trypsin-like peptidase domain
MDIGRSLAGLLCFCGLAGAATPREVFSNSAVYVSFSAGEISSSGSGFVLFRPADPSKANEPTVSGQTFLVTNKHVLPPEGKECKLSMRVTTGTQASPRTKTIEIPVVGSDGKYLNTVHLHPRNDVAAILVTHEIAEGEMKPEFVFTTLLGTKERLGNSVALAGDEIYILGYPAGIFDSSNANPIWRVGIISTNPLLGYSFPESLQTAWHLPAHVDGFLIDAQVYPGSSGSMVVNKPTSASFDSPSLVMAGGPRSVPYVLGIVSDSIPIIDANLHLVTRMGLGIVQSADAIKEAIESFFAKH